MNKKLTNNLYQIVKIVEDHNQQEQIDLNRIKPYLNEYIKLRKVPENHYITREEERLKKVYYIISGSYDMTRLSETGKMKVQAKKKAPQFIGIDKAVDRNLKGEFTSVALETCIILEIRQDYFVDCIKENGELAIIVIKNISEKLVNASLEVDRLIFKDSKEQLMYYIYQYWNENNTKSGLCRVAEKNSYTADNMGMSIRTFYRALNALKEDGFVSVNKGYIEVNESQMQKISSYLSE